MSHDEGLHQSPGAGRNTPDSPTPAVVSVSPAEHAAIMELSRRTGRKASDIARDYLLKETRRLGLMDTPADRPHSPNNDLRG